MANNSSTLDSWVFDKVFNKPLSNILSYILVGLFVAGIAKALLHGTAVAPIVRLLFIFYAAGLILARVGRSISLAPSRLRGHLRSRPSATVTWFERVAVAFPSAWSAAAFVLLLVRGAIKPRTLFPEVPLGREFFFHRKTSYAAIYTVFLISSMLELPVLVILANYAKLPPELHYALAIIGIEAVVFVIGDIRSVQRLPCRISGTTLVIECGARAALKAHLCDVASAATLEVSLGISNLSALAREQERLELDWRSTLVVTPWGACNVLVRFAEPIFSIRHGRSFSAAAMRLDEPSLFFAALASGHQDRT